MAMGTEWEAEGVPTEVAEIATAREGEEEEEEEEDMGLQGLPQAMSVAGVTLTGATARGSKLPTVTARRMTVTALRIAVTWLPVDQAVTGRRVTVTGRRIVWGM